jgi:site-specific DNA-cytosine methylase
VAFIFENVKGILSAEVQGTSIFRRILEDLMRPGAALGTNDGPEYMIYPLAHPGMSFLEYDPKDFVVESEQYGIPQTRHRVFLLGVRADIPRVPRFMPGCNQQVPIEAAIGDLPRLRAGLSRDDSPERWAETLRAILDARWLGDVDPQVRQCLEAAVSNPDTRLDRGAEFVPGRPAPGLHGSGFTIRGLAGSAIIQAGPTCRRICTGMHSLQLTRR